MKDIENHRVTPSDKAGNSKSKQNGLTHTLNYNFSTIGKTLLVFCLTILGGIAMAQAQYFERGDLMLGSDLGSGLVNTGSDGLFGINVGLNDGAGFSVGLSPKIGYFINESFLLGAAVNLGFRKSPANEADAIETTSYGFQGLTRFYITPADLDVDETVPRRSRFFLENNAGVAGVIVNNGPTTIGFAFGFGPGLAYFVTDNFALEATVKYNGLLGDDTADYQNSLGLNLGIQVFLTRANAENIIERQID